jgi:hypothetical protein
MIHELGTISDLISRTSRLYLRLERHGRCRTVGTRLRATCQVQAMVSCQPRKFENP